MTQQISSRTIPPEGTQKARRRFQPTPTMIHTREEFGQRLRGYRVVSGKTQTALAKRLRLKPNYVSRYESGTRIPEPALLERYLDALNVPNNEREELETQAEVLRQRRQSNRASLVPTAAMPATVAPLPAGRPAGIPSTEPPPADTTTGAPSALSPLDDLDRYHAAKSYFDSFARLVRTLSEPRRADIIREAEYEIARLRTT